jgi:hypothetical protein
MDKQESSRERKQIDTGNVIQVINEIQTLFEEKKYAKLIKFVSRININNA